MPRIPTFTRRRGAAAATLLTVLIAPMLMAQTAVAHLGTIDIDAPLGFVADALQDESDFLGSIATEAPAPWAMQDPADSLYRAARAALNDNEYRRAADLFGRLQARYPSSKYAPDSYYWRAFSLYRLGGRQDLDNAKQQLDTQLARFPKASTASDSRSLRARIEGQLAQRGDAGAAENTVRRSRSACEGEDGDVKLAALNALIHMNSDRALPILKSVLSRRDGSACSAEMRKKAVFLVANTKSDEAAQILIDVVRNDPEQKVREDAVFWLSETKSPLAATALEEMLRNSSDTKVKKKAIFALANMKTDRSLNVLRQYAERESNPVELRADAIFWLAEQKKSPEMAGYLRELYGKTSDPKIKERLFFALSQMRGQGNERWLMEVAMNPQESTKLRKQALFWAAESGAVIGELVSLYDRRADRDMKEQLIFIYSQRKEPQAIDKLIQIAKTEKDRELRKKAIFWLSESKDPRAVELLMELINQ